MTDEELFDAMGDTVGLSLNRIAIHRIEQLKAEIIEWRNSCNSKHNHVKKLEGRCLTLMDEIDKLKAENERLNACLAAIRNCEYEDEPQGGGPAIERIYYVPECMLLDVSCRPELERQVKEMEDGSSD